MESNYTKQVYMARELFMRYDQSVLIDRYGLENDGDYLYIIFFGDRYRIERAGGKVEVCTAPGQFALCEDYNIVMTIYDVLCHPQGKPELSGEWGPLYGLQATMSSPSADIFVQKYADIFAGQADLLWRACERTGGKKIPVAAGADVYWQFEVFPFFPLQFRFWDRDEEFPAQIRLLWDRNSLKFMHFETLYYVIGHLMKKLLAAAGIQEKGAGR